MKLLDLFCGAGGAGMGYHLAGFEVVGVDNHPQPHYPFEFIQADAFEFVAEHGREFDMVHASPPCQPYCLIAHKRPELRTAYPSLVEPTRAALIETGKPFVIENVPQAPLQSPFILCGYTFGLRVYRHRAFESNRFVLMPSHRPHREHIKQPGNSHRLALYVTDLTRMVTVAGHTFGMPAGKAAMGIDWMTRDELAEAIPPAYTQWIGEQLMRGLAP